MNFTKMHGCANDYIYVDCTKETVQNPGSLAVRLSDRRTGIGGDGMDFAGKETGELPALRRHGYGLEEGPGNIIGAARLSCSV
jgi:diaminopimelate epimerase